MPDYLQLVSETRPVLTGFDPGLGVDIDFDATAPRPAVTVRVVGDLDHTGGPLLQSIWDTRVAVLPLDAHLDLGGVAFCNAAGLRSLAQISATAQRRGSALRLTAKPHLAHLLCLAGVDAVSEGDPRPRPATVRLQDLASVTAWARGVASDEQPDVVAALIATARHTLPASDSVNVLLTAERRTRSAGFSGPVGDQMADAEESAQQGPALQSRRDGADVFVGDLWDPASRLRWPRLIPFTSPLPVRSLMCLHLGVAERSLGTLTVSSGHPLVFDDAARGLAAALASVASVALIGVQDRRQLADAVSRRDTIGQAKGILIERHRLTADQAFEVLRTASVRTHTKVHRIAETLVESGALGVGSPQAAQQRAERLRLRRPTNDD